MEIIEKNTLKSLMSKLEETFDGLVKYIDIVKCDNCDNGVDKFIVIKPINGKEENIYNWLNLNYNKWSNKGTFWFVTGDELEVELDEEIFSNDFIIGNS
jgi:hypothetical protein